MALLCAGNELFYIFLYYYHFYPKSIPSPWFEIIFYGILGLTWGGKQFMNVLQMWTAATDIIDWEFPEKKQK